MTLFLWIVALAAGLMILSYSSDWFINSAEIIGVHFHLPGFIIGVVIIGFGTSLPELASSIVAVLAGNSEIVISNAVGSNITNIFLVLGVSALFAGSYVIEHDIFRMDMPFLIGSAILLSLMTYDQIFSVPEALICLACLALYLYQSITGGTIAEKLSEEENRKALGIKPWIILLLCPAGITLGADMTVRSVVKISEIIGIGTDIIAVTAVALGTSLPEVMVSVQAARKGKGEIAVGNVIGSNIFNSFAVMGISALFGPLKITDAYPVKVLPFFIAATILSIYILQDKKVHRFEGLLLLIFYIFFLGNSFALI